MTQPTHIKRQYASLTAFYADLGDLEAARDIESESFSGASHAKAMETRLAWPEPFERLPAQTITGQARRVRTWSEYDGESLDMERYFDGRPCLARKVKVYGGQQRKVIRLTRDICYSWLINAEDIKKESVDLMKRIDVEETAGNRCEVVCVARCNRFTTAGHDGSIEVTLKRADEPLNMERIAAGMSPWFFRRWFFLWQDVYAKRNKTKVEAGRGEIIKQQEEK
jgi:hypothetical protein